MEGQFGEASCTLRRGQTRLPATRLVLSTGQSVRDCERLVKLEGRLPAVLRGEDHPADADERVAFAWMGYCKGVYGASASPL